MSAQKPERRRSRPAQPQRPNPQPVEVVYTQPKPFQRRRLLLQLVTIFAVVLAIFLGMSVFFRVETVLVSGANRYSPDTVWEASDIQKGDSLLFLPRASIYAKIRLELPYVENVRYGIKLPGTVMIIIEEIPVVYAIKSTDGSWWLMSSEGKLTEKTDAATANNCTRITGVELQDPQVGQQAVAYQMPQDPGATDPVTVYASDRLNAALAILQQLEANEILGTVNTVHVEDPLKLEVMYDNRFQVILGDTSRLDYKIAAVKRAAIQLGEQCAGILDASFTSHPDEVWYSSLDKQ